MHINDNLEEQNIFLFKKVFYKNKKVKYDNLINLANLYQPKTISSDEFIEKGKYFVYGSRGIIGNYDKFNHENEEIVVSCRGECGFPFVTAKNSWINGNCMVVQTKKDFPFKFFLYYHLLFISPKYLVTGSVQQQLTRTNFAKYKVYLPSIDEIKFFENIANKNRKMISKNKNEIIELEKMRDFLLPLLMNGQATIED